MIGIKRSRNKEKSYSPKQPLSRVELHVHLDGALRAETIWELSKKKSIKLPGKGLFEELRDYLVLKTPKDLAYFLSKFDAILPCILGDLSALERIAYEFVEDSAISGVLYSEARFCPHLLFKSVGDVEDDKKLVWEVTGALIKGLIRGEKDFGCKVNLIATVIRGISVQWYKDTLELAADKSFHGDRIVGIDIAALPETQDEKFSLEPEAVALFDKATKAGIHRTCHAGESGPASQVSGSIDILHAERIGHGYRCAYDSKVYDRVRKDQVHLECCPWSSILTGSVLPAEAPHPIVKFFEDGLNISINTDDPTITGTHLDDEYRLLSNWGLSESHFCKANFNAARSAFLPENEKADLLQKLGKTYGLVQ